MQEMRRPASEMADKFGGMITMTKPASLQRSLPPQQTMRRAFTAKDPQFDGVFVVAVMTTGIFCRPVCRAKAPRLQNVEFFASPAEALHHGYRPCKLCRPLDAGNRPPRWSIA